MMTTLLIAIALYVIAVIGLGTWATRRSSASPQEYFLAGRSLGPIVLFMALFGTNATAFVLVGIPGRAYHDGIATFGLNVPTIALGIPLTFWAIGAPARRIGARLGALTPAELYARRFDSRGVGFLLFFLFTLYTVPYMVTAVKGAAITLDRVTDSTVPEWLGGLAVTFVALLYTTLGGMRATAWTNVLQGGLFLLFMVASFFLMSGSMGGLDAAFDAVRETRSELLSRPDRGLFEPAKWTSWGIAIALTVIAFPHMLVRLMSGKSDATLKTVCKVYPIALILLWVPAVMIGVWGAASFPGLEGRASDQIFALMSSRHLPEWLAACGFLAVLAAVMSTLDAQILTLGSMLTRDVMKPTESPDADRASVRRAQAFGALVALVVYLLALVWGQSVFDIAKIAFSGYVTLFPTLLLGVRWRRFTKQGAIASLLVGNLVYAAGLLEWIPLGGFLPVFWALVSGFLAAYLVSVFGPPGDASITARAFGNRPVLSS